MKVESVLRIHSHDQYFDLLVPIVHAIDFIYGLASVILKEILTDNVASTKSTPGMMHWALFFLFIHISTYPAMGLIADDNVSKKITVSRQLHQMLFVEYSLLSSGVHGDWAN